MLARRDAVKADLDAFLRKSNADLAPLLRKALQPALAAYEELKTRGGRLDFLDLLIKARNLIHDNAPVRSELQKRFTHYFVDEFQDTDPIQAELLLLLSADKPDETNWLNVSPLPGKLFVVGDPKQSIYRFRRADVAIYQQVKQMLLSHGAESLYLNTSFRSPPSLQSFVNAAFAPAMAGTTADGQYVPLDNWRPEITGRPTIVALPVPQPYGDYGTIVNFRIDESLPEATGAYIDWLVNQSGWTVEENGGAVPISPRHICILFRRLRNFSADITRPYVRALEARRLPHVLVGGRSFHDREEIVALRNALTAIEWPDDELRVYATLRGPLFAFSDDALFVYRQTLSADGELQIRRLHPMHPVDQTKLESAAQQVADALTLLGHLHVGRNRRPIGQTILMLLDAVRAHAGIAMWPTGEQALANCLRMVDMARRFEQRGASSFRAFVECMEADAEAGQAEDAPIVEQGTEGVRMMTVHRAKGLEFPVVILADPTCPAARDIPSRHVDPERRLWLEPLCACTPVELLEASEEELLRDQAEAIRLAYVAATRARDLLVVPACGDRPLPGWLEVLNPALYPSDDAKGQAEPVPGAPSFGGDSVVNRGPRDARVAPHSFLFRTRSASTSLCGRGPLHLGVGARLPSILLAARRRSRADRQPAGARPHGHRNAPCPRKYRGTAPPAQFGCAYRSGVPREPSLDGRHRAGSGEVRRRRPTHPEAAPARDNLLRHYRRSRSARGRPQAGRHPGRAVSWQDGRRRPGRGSAPVHATLSTLDYGCDERLRHGDRQAKHSVHRPLPGPRLARAIRSGDRSRRTRRASGTLHPLVRRRRPRHPGAASGFESADRPAPGAARDSARRLGDRGPGSYGLCPRVLRGCTSTDWRGIAVGS